MSKKNEFIFRLESFKQAHYELLKAMDEHHQYIGAIEDNYPFHKSFEELEVSQWIDKSILNLRGGVSYMNDTACAVCNMTQRSFDTYERLIQFQVDGVCDECMDGEEQLVRYKKLSNGWHAMVWYRDYSYYEGILTEDLMNQPNPVVEKADTLEELQILKLMEDDEK